MSSTVIYHSADYDGMMSGAIMQFALSHGGVVPTMIGWDYGQPEPEVSPDENLYIVDLAVPGLMNHPRLCWIDHHQTSIEKYDRPDLPGIRIDGVAACRLCWQWQLCADLAPGGSLPTKEQYVNREVEEPSIIRLLGEYDVWDDRNSWARPLQLGLQASGYKLEFFLDLLQHNATHPGDVEDHVFEHIQEGQAIQKYNAVTNKKMVNERGYRLKFEGLDFIALNHSVGNSILFEGYDAIEEVDACLLWRWDGSKVVVSLYHTPHRKDIDLSEIARKLGGGGHRGACGFTLGQYEAVDRLMGGL